MWMMINGMIALQLKTVITYTNYGFIRFHSLMVKCKLNFIIQKSRSLFYIGGGGVQKMSKSLFVNILKSDSQELFWLYSIPPDLGTLNSLYTELHFLQVLLKLLIPCMSRISTSTMSTGNFS